MASIRKIVVTPRAIDEVWDAVRDVGALHTRLVPGFAVATELEPGARLVTFASGATVREPIVTVDDRARRLVWTATGGATSHYNAALEVLPDGDGTRLVWTVDLLPDGLAPRIEAAMSAGIRAMQAALGGSEASAGA